MNNTEIEKAIQEFRQDNSKENMMNVINHIQESMNDSGELYIAIHEPDMSKMDKSRPQVAMRKLVGGDGQTALCAFTSREEVSKGDKVSITAYPTEKFIEVVGSISGIDGVVINPWGNSIFLTKDLIAAMNEDRQYILHKANESAPESNN